MCLLKQRLLVDSRLLRADAPRNGVLLSLCIVIVRICVSRFVAI